MGHVLTLHDSKVEQRMNQPNILAKFDDFVKEMKLNPLKLIADVRVQKIRNLGRSIIFSKIQT